MATVINDLLDGHGVSKSIDGYVFDRIAIVEGATGEGHSKVYNAMNDTEMPDIGDPHPALASALLRTIDFVEMTHKAVKFRLHYAQKAPASSSGFDDDSIQSGASVIQASTNKDINGVAIELNYTYPEGYQRSPHDTPLAENTEAPPQGAFVTVMRPQSTRALQKILSYDPQGLADTYAGKINSSLWQGKAAKTVLCTAIRGYSDDGGDTYKTTFEYQYNSKTWVGEAVFIKDDGKPPDTTDTDSERSIVLGNPIEIYETIGFSGLPF